MARTTIPIGVPAANSSGSSPHSSLALRMLLVDDNEDAAETLGMLLRLRGVVVGVAFDGYSALRMLPVFQPEVVLLDLGMPEIDGYEVALQIRGDPAYDAVTLVAITGWGHDSLRRRSRDTGFAHHLVKPIDVDSLMSLLATRAVAGESTPNQEQAC